jgi:hypothetical protein
MKDLFDLLPAFRSRHAATVLQKFEKQKTFLFASVHCEAIVFAEDQCRNVELVAFDGEEFIACVSRPNARLEREVISVCREPIIRRPAQEC